jgi:cytochrome b pre-mRNA-processing protein 3
MNLINWLWQSSAARTNAEKLYGAIVAQARLPQFYARLGVPDSLEGRFVILQIHLFAVLHRLKHDGAEARAIAQELVDLFTKDMETVLREQGVGDLSIPKKVRTVSAATQAFVLTLERAYQAGCGPVLRQAIAEALPEETDGSPDTAAALAHYLEQVVTYLAAQPIETMVAGSLQFPEVGTDDKAP